jgi:hypothetical protein
MNLLKTQFESKGFLFNQLERNEVCAIYSKTFRVDDNTLGSENFEVIDILSHNGREIHGNYQPPSEFFPSDNAWGRNGWSYTDKEKAYEKYRSRTQDRLEKLKSKEINDLCVSEEDEEQP